VTEAIEPQEAPVEQTARPPVEASSEERAFRAPGWPATIALLIAIAGSVAFVYFYVVDASTQRLGGSLALAFLGLGVAVAYWGRDLTPDEAEVARYPLPPERDEDEIVGLGDELEADTNVITRRRFLTTLLLGALGVFGLSQVVLVASLGPKSRGLFSTAWRAGARLVTFDGRPITSDALDGGGSFLVAFPEGYTDAADAQVILLRLPGVAPLPGRESWSPQGFFAYSRVCTHAGCAVAQYEKLSQLMLCPCHQSRFDLTNGCKPAGGPAARALPQLPLAIDANGFLVAQSDFTEPIGPGFWNLYA
jgi:ubiquinol-cytochrome c reductase iron-sulfur subunit